MSFIKSFNPYVGSNKGAQTSKEKSINIFEQATKNTPASKRKQQENKEDQSDVKLPR